MRKYGRGRIQDYLIGVFKISEVVDLINVPYLLYIHFVFRQAGLGKECRTRSDSAPGQGLHSLPRTLQFKIHSQTEKETV